MSIYRRVTSTPYVEVRDSYPMGQKNWRYRVVDLLVAVYGDVRQLDKMINAIEGFAASVEDMWVT